jgi:CHAT domain-containing protein/tetratricopeptide (TPR) repeat protein
VTGSIKRVVCLVFVLALSCLVVPRRAYPKQFIRADERREGVLRISDPIRAGSSRGAESLWVLQGSIGQGLTIAAESYEFYIYLLLLDPRGRQVAWNDSSGGFLGAQIRTILPETGLYTIAVCGADADQYGFFWLSVDEGGRDLDSSQPAFEATCRRGIEWSERTGSQRAAAFVNLAMGRHLAARREWGRADNYYTQSLDTAEKGGFTYSRWAARLERGRLLARRMVYDQAIRELQSAVELSKELRAVGEAEIPALLELGNVYRSMETPDLAKIYLQTATRLAEQSGLPATLVNTYTSLDQSLRSEDKEEAITYAEKAYALSDGLTPVLALKATCTLAGAYLFLEPGRSEEGFRLAAKGLQSARELGQLDDEVSVTTLMSMGYYKLNKVDDMIRSARDALALTDPNDEDPGPRRIALQLEADGEMLRGNYQTAFQLCFEALNLLEGEWSRTQIEEMRRGLLSQSKAICTQVIRNLYLLNSRHPSPNLARQAFDFAERSRCRSLLEQLATEQKQASLAADPGLRDRDERLQEGIASVGAEFGLLRSEGPALSDTFLRLQERRAKLVAEKIQLETEIQHESADGYDASLLSPLKATQVQRNFLAAHRSSVILYYQLGVQESFLIVLGPGEAHLVSLPNWTTISKSVTEWRSQILHQSIEAAQSKPSPLTEYAVVAHHLYSILIGPAARFIRGRDLVIVPSDALHELAFEALVVGDPSTQSRSARTEYLFERHAISYAPSLSTLALIENRQRDLKSRNKMLLLGDAGSEARDTHTAESGGPNTRRSDPMAAINPLRFRSNADMLPAARQEIVEIADLARRRRFYPTIWVGDNATKHRFVDSDLAPYRYIHFATHSLADYHDGYFSSLTLSSGREGSQGNVLTSYEISRLKLTADLVVLSACETGAGQRTGAEGMIGLTRTFLVAGARGVCGSLWPVQDASTEKLMKAFYERLLAGDIRTPEALRQAKLSLLREGATPAQWAAFILVGSPR